ncbi:hypothetical protein [Altererythrobacter sp. MTPC7]|uniref:hypothetical protein n=1 Tax=Altererythrobacter sp. MTPC7 TaxID=3056567 RepID=UPI0036F41E4A
MTGSARIHACASLAGSLFDRGLDHTDAPAFDGLLSLSAHEFAELVKSLPDSDGLPMLDLVVETVRYHAEELELRSAVRHWAKRKADYDADCTSWKKRELEVGDGWRTKPMTAGQRFLLADTALILEIEIPAGMNRGNAADWLDANGANVLRKLGE